MLTNYFVYITTKPAKTVLYTGVTNDIKRRMKEHFLNRGNEKTFAGRFYCYNLVYYEEYFDVRQAIEREKEIKDFSREKKVEIIISINPNWHFYRF